MNKSITQMGLLLSGHLAAGESFQWWVWPFASYAGGNFRLPPSIWAQPVGPAMSWETQYWFTVTPVNPPGFVNLVPYDQHVGITEVSWIRKGELHELDMTGGAGDLLLEITVTNFFSDRPADYDLWMHQADIDLQE